MTSDPQWIILYELPDSDGDEDEITVPGVDEEDARCVAELRLEGRGIYGAKIITVKAARP